MARTNPVSGLVPQVGHHHHPNASIAMMRIVLLDEIATIHTIAGTTIAIRPVTALYRLQTVRHSSRSRKTNSAICGKRHGGHCKFSMHPDANHDPNVKWLDTQTGKAMVAAGAGSSIDLKQWCSHTEKRLVPLDASISQQISAAIPKKLPKGETVVNTVTEVATRLVQPPNNKHGPPCCVGAVTHSDQDCLAPGQLLLTSTIVPINVLIDTGCMQTNVLRERIGPLLTKGGGKGFETDVALTCGVGGVSYAVQGIMTLMVARPINTPPSKYRHV